MRIHSRQRVLASMISVVALASMVIGASASSSSASERDYRAFTDDRQTTRGVSWE
jgi:hypothetical protein